MRFAMLGDGRQAQVHKEAIANIGGEVISIFDPKHGDVNLLPDFFERADYIVICSPSHIHKRQVDYCKRYDVKMIVEKPYCLPHEKIEDDDNIFVCLQLRWMINLPEKADRVQVAFRRNAEWFSSWKGDYFKTGGVFFNLFVHYIDLAMIMGADFEGMVDGEHTGPNHRRIDNIDILETTKSKFLYTYMYHDIVRGEGVHPQDIKRLHEVLSALSLKYGYGSETLGKLIKVSAEELRHGS